MKLYVERFLTHWWSGLSAPFTGGLNEPSLRENSDISIIQLDPSTGELDTKIFATKDFLDKPLYFEVPKDQVLNIKLNSEQNLENTSMEEFIGSALPFKAEELFIAANNDYLLAVLRSDIAPIQQAVMAHDKKLDGLIFSNAESQVQLHLESRAASGSQTRRLLFEKFVTAIAVIALCLTALIWHLGKQQQLEISQLSQSLRQAEESSFNASLDDNFIDGSVSSRTIIDALEEIKNTIDKNTNVNQIGLQWTDAGLRVLLDAESGNAASLLTRFEQNPRFSASEFISAITNDPNINLERYRLKTVFTHSASPDSSSVSSNERANDNE